MAQGKEWTIEEKNDIVQSMKPFLEAGLSRNKACDAIGLTPSTLSNWVKADAALGMKLKGWENTLNLLAMSNVASALQTEAEQDNDARKETSKWWLERRMKNEFSTRKEHTGKEGETLVFQISADIADKNGINTQTEGDSEG